MNKKESRNTGGRRGYLGHSHRGVLLIRGSAG